MKRLLILIGCVLLVGCNTNELESRISELESQIVLLENDILSKSELLDDKDAAYDALVNEMEATDDRQNSVMEGLRKQLEDKDANIQLLIAEINELHESALTTQDIKMKYDLRIIGVDGDLIHYDFIENSLGYAQNTMVLGNKTDFNPLIDEKEVTVVGDGYETLRFNVVGRIRNVKYAKVNWNDDYSEYEEGEGIVFFQVLEDRIIDFRTSIPEGIPGEMIRWTNDKGEKFQMLIGYDGLGLEGEIIDSR